MISYCGYNDSSGGFQEYVLSKKLLEELRKDHNESQVETNFNIKYQVVTGFASAIEGKQYTQIIPGPPGIDPSASSLNDRIGLGNFPAHKPSWLLKCTNQLAKLRQLRDNWNGMGSLRPNATAIKNSENILYILHRMNFEPKVVTASAQDGVAISFSNNNRSGLIEAYNEGDILIASSVGSGKTTVWMTGESDAEIIETLERFYGYLYSKNPT